MRRAYRLIAILTVLVAAVTAASAGPATADPPPEYFVDEAKLPFAALPGIATDRYWGIQNGARYRIEVPKNWNHRRVMWAHGFRGSGLELTVDNHPLRAFLAATRSRPISVGLVAPLRPRRGGRGTPGRWGP